MSWWRFLDPPQAVLEQNIKRNTEEFELRQAANTCKYYGKSHLIHPDCPYAEEYKKLICNYCTVQKCCVKKAL